jgi:hypothetical protein
MLLFSSTAPPLPPFQANSRVWCGCVVVMVPLCRPFRAWVGCGCGHRTAGLRPGLSWVAPLGRRAGTFPGHAGRHLWNVSVLRHRSLPLGGFEASRLLLLCFFRGKAGEAKAAKPPRGRSDGTARGVLFVNGVESVAPSGAGLTRGREPTADAIVCRCSAPGAWKLAGYSPPVVSVARPTLLRSSCWRRSRTEMTYW